MRSIKRAFEKIKRENPNWSDYTCFFRAVSGRDFSKKMIAWHFSKLVDKSDYSSKDKKKILEWLFRLSQGTKNRPEEGRF
ncbi:hypothetical protein ANME2D_02503 [Candidatus Methanoperedens nitroreducens]|uniref:Uncharacterized protein n=1 Tax=Candidatus Methanoperedens nitratireducens TaxID=1392998 RepID=A0A062UWB3_9EURY|nr:hypothetical protein [Candidatus Methanoperedens nitroreducens]KCZ71301.1 hypothetical protein ANME2D_02503 [Candidatus Methanoperedens nitroreducens]MDJ1423762.1 hypothetical protein [Candidatus Methanoperedens sp.]